MELALADLETTQKQLSKIEKAARADKSIGQILDSLKHASEQLDEGVPIYKSDLTSEERELLSDFFLLTDKPVLAVVNMGEDQVEETNQILEPVIAELSGQEVIGMCVQLESEAALLTPEEQAEMLEALGLGEGALSKFVRSAYHLLGLRTFFTTGEKESKAWTFRENSNAPECAGRIHTDFQKGFIRAETIEWQLSLEQGSWLKAREAGLVRSEGKDYKPEDGDVMEFRFNVCD